MKSFAVPTANQVDQKSQEIFAALTKKIGFLPNLYAAIGHSSNALESYLAFSGAQAKGSFSAKEREAVFLAVSEVNGCAYCLAAHTAIAKMNGFSEDETLELRAGTITDSRLNILTNLAANIASNRGRADQDLVAAFFAQGFDEKALIDLVALVIDISFTNYTHNLTEVAVDFPAAKSLDSIVTA
ncbi:MAG: carboxymuconolactone decarboxylase family protein [Bacteroidota bacterium]